MIQLLEALAASGVAATMRTSFYIYPLVNAAHIASLGALVTTAILMDLRVLGLGKAVPLESTIKALRPIAIGALLLAAVTGVLLFSVQPFDYVDNPAFRIKMLLLVLGVGNAALFTFLRAHRRSDAIWSRLMALSSIGLWLAILVMGRFIGFLGE